MRATLLLLLLPAFAGAAEPATELTVATFNAWGAGYDEGQPVAQAVAVL